MAELTDKLNIRIHVYDIDMSVKIPRADEELYRRAASLITEVLSNYNEHYKGLKSDKEIHYMALVDIALRLGREQQRNDITPMLDILSAYSREIKDVVAKG